MKSTIQLSNNYKLIRLLVDNVNNAFLSSLIYVAIIQIVYFSSYSYTTTGITVQRKLIA